MGIALERCFTELLQGETTAGLKNALQPILPDTDAQAGQFWRREFCHAFRDYKSAQKSSMFRNTARMNKKDIFRSDDLTSVTTLNCLLQKVEDLGYDLLIRDHTFLGFPAYQLFIPGLSELQSLDSGLLAIHDRVQKARQIFFNLDKANKEDLLFLTAVIDELSSTPTVDKLEIMETIHNIPAGRNSTLYCLDYRWFASIIHFHTGNHSEAKRLLDEFIHEMGIYSHRHPGILLLHAGYFQTAPRESFLGYNKFLYFRQISLKRTYCIRIFLWQRGSCGSIFQHPQMCKLQRLRLCRLYSENAR